MADLVKYEVQNEVAVLHMDDGKANALSPAMSKAIDGALDRAESAAKAIVLHGRHGVLCGGYDLQIIRGED